MPDFKRLWTFGGPQRTPRLQWPSLNATILCVKNFNREGEVETAAMRRYAAAFRRFTGFFVEKGEEPCCPFVCAISGSFLLVS
jgi:hypothetical protein